MFRLIAALMLVLLSVQPAVAADSPLKTLEDALSKLKLEQSSNGFAGYAGTCLSGMAVTNSGVTAPYSLRTCYTGMLTWAQIVTLSQQNGWPVAFQGTFMWMFKASPPAAGSPQAYYMVYFNKAGNVSEIVVTLDSTTD